MTNKPLFLIGDLIIFNNTNIVGSDYRHLIEKGVPYYITRFGYGSDTFYIKVYGKEIMIIANTEESYEHIAVAKRSTYKVGDCVYLVNQSEVEGANELGFQNNIKYKITKIINENEFLITNGINELLIKDRELTMIQLVNEGVPEKDLNKAIAQIEKMNYQNLIDKALDEKDFEKLDELRKLHLINQSK